MYEYMYNLHVRVCKLHWTATMWALNGLSLYLHVRGSNVISSCIIIELNNPPDTSVMYICTYMYVHVCMCIHVHPCIHVCG